MGRISRDDVRYVAKLAELDIEDEEIEKITSQLDKILDYVAEVSRVDTEGITPLPHILDIKNVLREDVPGESITPEAALKNAPDESDSGFKVPKID
ncbi:MAG: Asp-tRNA(Asn)/Glu-tRNA(Gln) amidotransferase subunit GatC [Actinomycetota bacterium]|nr:Asp-tRNA(Asn)/Glu-tRNA(Gln) amidotransferase subunit GatC [Actinomycetota bacterium]